MSEPHHPVVRRALARLAAAALCLAACAGPLHAAPVPAQVPTPVDCAKANSPELAALLCKDPALAPLEARLQQVVLLAQAQAQRWGLDWPRDEQARWQRGRADCLKQPDPRACLALGARRRIAELLAVYALVQGTAPRNFICGTDGKPIMLIFFATDPATAVARRGEDTITLYAEPAGGALRYAGSGWLLAEEKEGMRITAGRGAPEQRCRLQR